jgi:hypothetical protein
MVICHLGYQEVSDRIILNEYLGISYEAHFSMYFYLYIEFRETYEQITLFIDISSASLQNVN